MFSNHVAIALVSAFLLREQKIEHLGRPLYFSYYKYIYFQRKNGKFVAESASVVINKIVLYSTFISIIISSLKLAVYSYLIVLASTIYLCFFDIKYQVYVYCTLSNLECQN